ncbi:MAG TPA: hypothetical protein VF121_15070 [Thermoanaerobaculia bacterium]|nr:hypothetical protein [Thermoanaerobaculia bacterium]
MVEQLRQDESVPAWGLVQRALFRFLFSYFVLYNFPFFLDVIPVYGAVPAPRRVARARPLASATLLVN